MTLPMKTGVDYSLEEEADELLAQCRREGHPEDDYLVLSPGQMDRRRSREIYNRNGFPESHLFSGLYRRVHNPLIGTKPTVVSAYDDSDLIDWDTRRGWGQP